MTRRIAKRLEALGIELPAAQPPVATYVPYVVTGSLIVVSGQLPMVGGKPGWTGKVGLGVTLEESQMAARQCFLNVLAHVAKACDGDLDRVARVVRLGGFVACAPDFTKHAQVMNGASDLAWEIFGDTGRHARATVGVTSLPLDAPVEVEAVFEID